jgi:hypothetical protein
MKFKNCSVARRLTPAGAWSQTSGNAAGAVTAWSAPRFLPKLHTTFSCCATVTSPNLVRHLRTSSRPPWRLCAVYSEQGHHQDRPYPPARQRKRALGTEGRHECEPQLDGQATHGGADHISRGSAYASIVDILLRCREPALWAISRLSASENRRIADDKNVNGSRTWLAVCPRQGRDPQTNSFTAPPQRD